MTLALWDLEALLYFVLKHLLMIGTDLILFWPNHRVLPQIS